MDFQGKYLITTDNWFYGPDGKQYKAVWGEVRTMSDQTILGIKTNARSSNWYLWVGDKDIGMVVAGCQVHYAIKCPCKPDTGMIDDYTTQDGFKEFRRPSSIYIAELGDEEDNPWDGL